MGRPAASRCRAERPCSQPPAASPQLPAAWEIFRWKSAFPRPTLIKAWRKGREFLPAQVTPLRQFPTCSSLAPRPARESCREPGPGRRWSGSPAHARPSRLPLIHRDRHSGGFCGWVLPPQPVSQVPSEECLAPPAALWSGVLKDCRSQTHPEPFFNPLRSNGLAAQEAITYHAGIWWPCVRKCHLRWPGDEVLGPAVCRASFSPSFASAPLSPPPLPGPDGGSQTMAPSLWWH